MKRKDLLRALAAEAKLRGMSMDLEGGGSHTKVRIGNDRTVVPRHREINELTASSILKQMGAKR